nr:Nif3-like dinuclear metal center hexameric protein [Desulfobulbaceae bacterium]
MSNQTTLKPIIDIINSIAPFSYAENWDNVGLLIGDPGMEVTGILIGLDPTSQLLDEAIQSGANLVITHHPAIFKPLTSIRTDTPNGAFIAKSLNRKIAVIGCHTNLDVVKNGVSEILARKLGAVTLQTLVSSGQKEDPEIGFGQLGQLENELSPEFFLNSLCNTLKIPAVKIAGQLPTGIRTIAVCGGSGSDLAEKAFAAGAQIYITGEVKHSTARWAEEANFCIVDAGHYATENCITEAFATILQKHLADRDIAINTLVAQEQDNPFSYYIVDSN